MLSLVVQTNLFHMMVLKIVFFLFLFSSSFSFAARKNAALTPFQKNIQTCLQDKIEVRPLNNLAKVYAAVSEKYILLSSEILSREVLYKVKDELRKLRYENGKIELFKILEQEEGRAVPLNNEARQKSLTIESDMAQLLIHADIRSDWTTISEKRAGGTFVVMTKTDGEIRTLLIERTILKKKLECARTEGVESCSCTDTK